MTDTTTATIGEMPTPAGEIPLAAEETTAKSNGDDTDEDDPAAGPDDNEALTLARHQAKKYRARLRETEAERDQLREQLTAQQRAVVNWRATNSQGGAVDPQLLDAADIRITDLLDDNGHLDMTAVDDFIDSTATRFRVHRMMKPNPQQGNPGGPQNPGLAAAFDPRRHQ